MRVLFIDLDTLRPDHLGCYGYKRDTSPCIDSIAEDGMIFTNYYTPNAPCLPSRAALVSGLYGIQTGAVGHGGTAADMRLEGKDRDFQDKLSDANLFNQFRKAGMKTASVSTFAERHSSWWFNAGFDETYNVGGCGMESAEKVTPAALEWLERNADKDSWFLHVHYWDPHTPYRAPASFGNPFENEPLSNDWITPEIFEEHLLHAGPHGAQEISMYNDTPDPRFPRHPGRLDNVDDVKTFIDNYDCGIRYADDNVRSLIDLLKEKGLYDDLAIIITSDHGENMGELGIYGEHATADHATCRIPMIIKWPGGARGFDDGLHLNIDLAPTIEELLDIESDYRRNGVSYADAVLSGISKGRDYAVLEQCAHVCQRSVRFDDYLYIRTIHDGYHLFDDEMLFDIKNDPFEQKNLAPSHFELCAKGAKLILDWEYEMMKTSTSDVDPMWTVMREGGPFHTRGHLPAYLERLRKTGRAKGAEELARKYLC